MKVDLELTVNGEAVGISADPRTTLADLLRDHLGLTGTHLGCEQGVCGSCTVLVDGHSARSCLMLAAAAQGREVTTIEGMASESGLHPVQEAFSRHHALQCGFCTPGFFATVLEMMSEGVLADEAIVRERLSGNLCRCTGYHNIVTATLELLGGRP
ncbi:MAG: (2Fe-2S)-binding protein [Acidimicrobiia bacterium]|nr:(2Fe-2S)-binding protein [Acidimicrobiia bacterium]MDH4305941.1 (2Fe-2S)-binding protein [Acidimicrobiia bacterium]MDH5295136.1 (2Fe-2S)-binding protein [Acidimicrobiia bacterium]